MSAGDHMVMGGFLVLLGSWMLGTVVGMLIAVTVDTGLGLLVGIVITASLVLAGTVEFMVGMIGVGVRLGRR